MSKKSKKHALEAMYNSLIMQCNAMENFIDVSHQYEERTRKELHFLYEFIHYKNLESEFTYFCEYAVEDPESILPFPHLTLLERNEK